MTALTEKDATLTTDPESGAVVVTWVCPGEVCSACAIPTIACPPISAARVRIASASLLSDPPRALTSPISSNGQLGSVLRYSRIGGDVEDGAGAKTSDSTLGPRRQLVSRTKASKNVQRNTRMRSPGGRGFVGAPLGRQYPLYQAVRRLFLTPLRRSPSPPALLTHTISRRTPSVGRPVYSISLESQSLRHRGVRRSRSTIGQRMVVDVTLSQTWYSWDLTCIQEYRQDC